jgi:predicted DNA binding protein
MNTSDVSTKAASTKTEAISFYKVPLQCGAAPHIGCGSRTKPVLLELEKQKKAVDGAWLNRTGTVIAVVWTSDISKERRKGIVEQVFQENNIPVRKAEGGEYHALLDDFRSGHPWYRGQEVDKLSTEEAEIIAERLVKRISSQTSVSEDKKRIITDKYTRLLKKELTRTFSSEINSDEETVFELVMKQINKQLLDSSRKQLNADQLNALNEALKQGYRPTHKDYEYEKDVAACSCCGSSNEK